MRLDPHVHHLRQRRVRKTTTDTRSGVTNLDPEAARPDALLALARGYWEIAIKQHYRRDHTKARTTARSLFRMRSPAVLFHERQRGAPQGARSLPNWQRLKPPQPSATGKLANRQNHPGAPTAHLQTVRRGQARAPASSPHRL